MKFYAGESLDDMIKSDQVPTSEKLIIGKIVLPICKALNAMHSRRILHLDIKPENIVIDENGEAVLIDFGVAQQYDENGKLISLRDTHSTSAFSAPENSDGNMRYFGPQADIFGTAATLFTLVSGKWPHPINDSQDRERAFELMNCSEGMKQAIAEGMSLYSNDRPANAQLFLNLFPGCENIKLD
jgi:serine/threonine protein kinase